MRGRSRKGDRDGEKGRERKGQGEREREREREGGGEGMIVRFLSQRN
jgi:hypothetical protein